MPKMSHPDSKQTIDVSDGMVDVYVSQGWESKSPPKK